MVCRMDVGWNPPKWAWLRPPVSERKMSAGVPGGGGGLVRAPLTPAGCSKPSPGPSISPGWPQCPVEGFSCSRHMAGHGDSIHRGVQGPFQQLLAGPWAPGALHNAGRLCQATLLPCSRMACVWGPPLASPCSPCEQLGRGLQGDPSP